MTEMPIMLELNSIKDKIKISPIGENVVGVDGRTYKISGADVLEATKALGVDLLLDRDHADSEAMGWFDINSLELREDGIYASLELTNDGQELVSKKSYKYLSPAYEVTNEGANKNVLRIASVGLVNRPNLLKKALNKGEKMDENLSLKLEIEGLIKENESLKKALKESKELAKNEKIESAILSGAMLPNRKENALNLEGAALDSFLEVCKSEAEAVLKNKSLTPQKKDDILQSIKDQLEI